jgi:hypothetical protein
VSEEPIPEIQRAVEKAAGCPARPLESVIVVEGWKTNIVWEGEVEVFELEGHPKAKRAYGWRDVDRGDFTAVLEIPPVDCPNTAVRATIVARQRAG